MNLKKYLLFGGVALGLGMTSCVGDLDLEPNDPNLVNTSDPNFKANALGICYSGIAVSGISGAVSSYVGGLDPGTSAYLRTIFTLGEFPTDELTWIWPNDEGGSIGDLIACTWSSSNTIVYGAYYRLLGHIAICNQFLANTADDTDAETLEMRAQARVLRAYSYYNMIDLFGQSSFITEEAEVGAEPVQASRLEVFNFIENELTEIVDQKLISENPVYGRVGLDGAEALLAVSTSTPRFTPALPAGLIARLAARTSSVAIRAVVSFRPLTVPLPVSPRNISISSARTTSSTCPAVATRLRTKFSSVSLSTRI